MLPQNTPGPSRIRDFLENESVGRGSRPDFSLATRTARRHALPPNISALKLRGRVTLGPSTVAKHFFSDLTAIISSNFSTERIRHFPGGGPSGSPTPFSDKPDCLGWQPALGDRAPISLPCPESLRQLGEGAVAHRCGRQNHNRPSSAQ